MKGLLQHWAFGDDRAIAFISLKAIYLIDFYTIRERIFISTFQVHCCEMNLETLKLETLKNVF